MKGFDISLAGGWIEVASIVHPPGEVVVKVGQAGAFGAGLDEVQQAVDVAESAVRRRAAAVPALWVPRTSSTSRDQAILVDQTTDASLSPDAVLFKIDRFG